MSFAKGIKRLLRHRFGIAAIVGAALLAGAALGAAKVREEMGLRSAAERARRLIAAKKFQEARSPLERWLRARPESAEATFLLAKGTLAIGDHGRGLIALDRAKALGYSPALIDRERAIALSRLGRYSEAEPILRNLQSSQAVDPEIDEALTRCYVETFQLRAAKESVERWVRDAPADAKTYFWRAQVGSKTNASQESLIADYEQALKLDPSYDEARAHLAEVYLNAHRLQEAEALYLILVAHKPDDPAAHLGLGTVRAQLGDIADAISHLERAAKLAPRDSRALVERGKIELRRRDLNAALAFQDRAIAIDPSEPESHYQRSLVLVRLGRTTEANAEKAVTDRLRREHLAIADILTALYQSPDDPKLQFNAARWLFDHGHADEGIRWANKILRSDPSHPETNRLLADYYQAHGNAGLANFHRLQSTSRPNRP